MKKIALFVASALCFAGPAHALTVGEFREAIATLHKLDPLTPAQRTTYVAAHKAELDVARVKLEGANLVRQTMLRANDLLIAQNLHPLLCNYEPEQDESDEMDMQAWVEEFRGESLEKHKMLAGPKTDALLDDVEFDDVITHKMLEKFPCPTVMPPRPQTAAAAPAHEHHVGH